MSRVYDSLKETLQRSKSNPVALARIKGNSALTVNDEMEDLEKIVLDRIGRLKAALKEGEAVVTGEVQHTEQLIASLRENITALEAKLREMDETLRRKASASQRMEESLTAKIHDLQNDVKKKEDALESRSNEINDLKSKIDGQVKQIAQLESAIQKVKSEAATQAKRADQITESSKTKIGALEAQLRDTEETVRGKDSTIKGLEQNLAAKIQNFENQLRDKEKLLAGRDVEINDLKGQLELLTRGIKEMSSFFRQAEALAAVEGQNGSTVSATEPSNGVEEAPAAGDLEDPVVTSSSTDTPQETVSPNFFVRVTVELTQALGPMASMIVRDHVAALGESIEKFPQARVGELLDTVSEEISDERQKIRFRARLAKDLWIT
jgi:DNA repair exonuclease SbcCD ATPase subunit